MSQSIPEASPRTTPASISRWSKLYIALIWLGLNAGAWQVIGPYADGLPLWQMGAITALAQLIFIPMSPVISLVTSLGAVIALHGALSFFGLYGLAEKWKFDRALDAGEPLLHRPSRKRRPRRSQGTKGVEPSRPDGEGSADEP